MADKGTFVGARLRVSTNEGDYEGTVHSIDVEKRKVTLSKVVSCSTGRKLHGFHHFFGHELTSLELLEEADNNASQDQLAENGQKHDNKKEKQLHEENSNIASNHSLQMSSKPDRGFGDRGVAKAFTDAGIGINSKLGVKKTAVSSGSFSRDVSDEGDSLLKRHPIIAEKYLSDATLDEEVKENTSPNELPDIVPIDSFGESFEEAVKFISRQRVIGVCCEGVNLGRLGKLCWLVIGCSRVIFLFDVLTLGAPCFDEGLQDILESGDILKVFHDCRLASDALFHQYHIHLMNVFDTQVADAIIYKNERGGELPRYVNGLVACLYEYLNLSPENVSFQKVRQKFMKTNASVWAVRPAPEALVDAAAKHVMYLRELRLAQMERLMAEFLYGVDIYLSIARDSKELNPKVKGQLLPAKFKELNHFNYRHRSRRYDGDFHEDAKGVVPEDVLASREAWCEGDQFTHAYENKKGRVKETVNSISVPLNRLKEKWRESGSDSDASNVTSESNGSSMEAALQNQGAAAPAVKSSSVSITARPQEIFIEKDFPPLSSRESEGPGTVPRQKEQNRLDLQADRRMEETVRETAHALGPGLQSNSAQPPSLLLQRANALLRESASLPGRGRAGALLRHAALPEVRLPGGSGYYHHEASGADRYDANRNEFHFPADEELLAAPEVVPVPNHHLVGGTTVRIRKT